MTYSVAAKKLIEIENGQVLVTYPYDPSGKFQQIAKTVAGWQWKKEICKWVYPVHQVAAVVEAFQGFGIEQTYAVRAEIIEQRQKAEALHHAQLRYIARLLASVDLDAPLPNGWLLRDYQKAGVEWLLAHSQGGIAPGGIFADDMGLGKAQVLHSQLLTPDGWVAMGDIQVGDFVIGSQGKAVRVSGVYPQGVKSIYRVTFTDDSTVDCCEEHLWAVRTPAQKYQGKGYQVLSLRQILDSGLAYSNGDLKYYIPMVEPIQFPQRTLPLDSYVLGTWLSESHENSIPNLYKFSAVEDRISLLQGLLDTDGSVDPNFVVRIDFLSKQLAQDVQYLVASLGGTARMKQVELECTDQEKGQTLYQLSIILPNSLKPFRVSVKQDLYHPGFKYQPTRAIKSVDYIGDLECQCISVDAADKLYVTDHCVVTHNTLQALVAARTLQQIKGGRVVVVCPVSLKKNWQREAGYIGLEIETYSWAKVPPVDQVQKPFILIGDESHAMQEESSARSQKMVKLSTSESCLATWLLTGTPMKNGRAVNLFPLLKAIQHPLALERWHYLKRYCGARKTDWGWTYNGATNISELNARIGESILRRTKVQCLTELPPKQKVVKEIEATTEEKKFYQSELTAVLKDYQERVDRKEVQGGAEVLVLLNAARRISSLVKAKHAIELAEEVLEQGESIVLFTEFVESAQLIQKALGGELLTGDVNEKHRQALVDRFQSGESRVFTGTIKAGGVGITLTKASNLVLVDRAWTPGDNEQASDRIHRIGQNDHCMIYWLRLCGTGSDIDAEVDQIVMDKQRHVDALLAGKESSFDEVAALKSMAKRLKLI